MFEENPDVDVILINSNDESETIPVSVPKSSNAVMTGKCLDSEMSDAASNSNSGSLNAFHETITLSSDSDTACSSPISDTSKRKHVSDSDKPNYLNHEAEKILVTVKKEKNTTLDLAEEDPAIEMKEHNLIIEKIIEENPRIEIIEEDLPIEKVIKEEPETEMVEEDPEFEEEIEEDFDIKKMMEENPELKHMIEERLFINKLMEEDQDIKSEEEYSETELSDENRLSDLENLSDVSDTSMMSDDISEGNDMEVPILDDEQQYFTPEEGDRIGLLGFDLQPYTVPDAERYGNCRLISEFKKISCAGKGSFGVVYKVLDIQRQDIVALKKMNISLRDKDPLSVNVMREMNLLRDLEHPNIVNSKGIAVGRNFDSTYLIMDYCDYDLARVVDDDRSSALLEEPQIKCIMFQLFEGLRFIHKQAIIHRDLSCSNVLFTNDGILKIGDFGLSRVMVCEVPMTPNIGSRWYRSLELLFGSKFYAFPVDLWSAGCIFAELMLRKPLFKEKTDMVVISLIIDLLGSPNETTWPGCSKLPVLELYELRDQPENRLKTLFTDKSETCIDLLQQLLTYDPEKRISAVAALSHPYFSQDPSACSPGNLLPVLEVAEEIESKRHYKSEEESHKSDENT